ncbi:MAG: HEPN domain-containing protein [Euryarchaeota archaeon]|nr:HEPN domain-containing protein [Euryarchaeota archaeon]
MKRGSEEAIRWLRQARHDLEVATKHLEDRFYSDACFMAEQASQKALKAYLTARGQRFILHHSVARLASEARRRDPAFKPAEAWGKLLDQYYIPTRYPDVLAPPAAPFEAYTQKQAREAVGFARKIVALAMEKMR